MSNAVREIVQDHLENYGVPSRMVCPACNGGSTREQCMTLFEGDVSGVGYEVPILATCHRAQCSLDTIQVYGNNTAVIAARPRQQEHWSSRVHDEVALPDNERPMIEANLDDHTLFRYCGWHEDSERIHVAMIDFTGHQRGIIARSYRPDATPKALTHKDEDYHGMSYFTRSAGVRLPSVLVVEDCMSGLVVYDDGYNAVSLNGTTLNDWRISELARAASEIVLCLDADATQLAARYVRRYRGVAPITMRRLHTDIKDKTAPVRQEWYKEIGYVSD